MTLDEATKRADRICKSPKGPTRTLLEYSLMIDVLRIVAGPSSVSHGLHQKLAEHAIRCADEYHMVDTAFEASACKDVR